jgi:hypothetical protein
MNRFNSTEEVEFNEEAMHQGREARIYGFKENDPEANPYCDRKTSWLYKSFIAGWADADMDVANGLIKPSKGR